ncbi:hypothetical protein CBS9595_004135 [Malassezia furfur]|nr:hypothetical protein CBS9595_004135 [Malassezia furfur]
MLWPAARRRAGAQAALVYAALCPDAPALVPRRAALRTLRHPTTREVLDTALVLFFPRPHSYTGEDVLELHVHGSPAVVRDTLLAIGAVDPAALRPALPGEFTRRAFEQGRMDLTSCEALDALLRAETSTQRRLALQTGGGRQAQLYHALRAELLEAMVRVEAMLDFSDEDGIDDALWTPVRDTVDRVRAQIRCAMPDGRPAVSEAIAHGTQLVLYGRPNAGKSLLLNRLVRREAAIVSPEAGTTRDVVQAALELHGFRVQLSDTAGLRTGAAGIEQQGIARTEAHVRDADLALLVCDAREACRVLGGVPPSGATQVSARGADALGRLPGEELLLVVNKMDTVRDAPAPEPVDDGVACHVWQVSALHDTGVDALLTDLGARLAARHAADLREPPLVTEARHAHLLGGVLAALDRCAACAEDATLVAEELRHAAYLVGQITGETLGADEVLGAIFARFCIGK